MSYILDALRRSQAERERGQVPGLNAQPATMASAPPQRRTPTAVWLGAAVLVLVGGGIAGWLLRAPAPGAVAPVAPAPAPRIDAMSSALPQVVSVPAPPPSPVPLATPTSPAAVPARPAPTTTVQAGAAAPAAAAAPAVAPRLPTLADLTAEQRRELPPLVLGGSIWSESALSRFVIVNGQVVREGEAAAPGVTVERIGPKAVVLRWRDLRFEVPT